MNTPKQPVFWHEKRYYSVDSYVKDTYGEKLYRISLNGGMSCPNRDGTLDTRGCIFCSEGGSGEFAQSPLLSIHDQIDQGRQLLAGKHHGQHYIAYFQAYTNTYAPVAYLRTQFMEAIAHPNIRVLAIATRPDCINEETLSLLRECNAIKPVWIELGLQTMHEQTASFIRRGYPLSCFEQTVTRLKQAGIPVIVHTILGLPGETVKMMEQTIDYVCGLSVFGIKLQLLHILKNTDLATWYEEHPFPLFTMEEYTDFIVQQIARMPQDIVLHRLTGDGPKNLLLAPLWSAHKKAVLNLIHHKLKERNIWQGKDVEHGEPFFTRTDQPE